MNDDDIVRPWLDPSSSTSSDVRSVLESAKSDGLSQAQVDALAKKVLALSAGAAAASSIAPAASSTSSALAAKLAVGAVILAFAGASVVAVKFLTTSPPRTLAREAVAYRSTDARSAQGATERAPAHTISTAAARATDADHTNVEAAPVHRAATPVAPRVTRREPLRQSAAPSNTLVTLARTEGDASPERAATNAADDVALLHRAAAALRNGAPNEASALLARHRRDFATSALSEERERIAIEALVRAGQRDDAARAAMRFREQFPGSAQQSRIDALVRSEAQH